MTKPLVHPIAEAWGEWLETPTGQTCADAETLRIPHAGEYLKNRLWHAFMAGVAAAEAKDEESA